MHYNKDINVLKKKTKRVILMFERILSRVIQLFAGRDIVFYKDCSSNKIASPRESSPFLEFYVALITSTRVTNSFYEEVAKYTAIT